MIAIQAAESSAGGGETSAETIMPPVAERKDICWDDYAS